MARRFLDDGRIAKLSARVGRLNAELDAAVVDGQIELTVDQISQIELTLSDPNLQILKDRWFDAPKTEEGKGSTLGYGGLKFEVAAVETVSLGGTFGIKVTARSAGAQELRRGRLPASQPGPPSKWMVWKDPDMPNPKDRVQRIKVPGGPDTRPPVNGAVGTDVSPTDYLRAQAQRVGLKFVGDMTAIRPGATGPMTAAPAGPGVTAAQSKQESMWDVAQRLAKESGFICYESGGTLYFGRPTWLVDRANAVTVTWGKEPGLLALPTCRRTGDDPQARSTSTVDLLLDAAIAEDIRPGQGLVVRGVPTFDDVYMVTKVSIPLEAGAGISVSAKLPENPTPEPPQFAAPVPGGPGFGGHVEQHPQAGHVLFIEPGKYGFADFNQSQVRIASLAYAKGRQMGLGQPEQIMAQMCMGQESTWRTGEAMRFKDHRSVGPFQQQVGPGFDWGTQEQCEDPFQSAGFFFTALRKEIARRGVNRPYWEIIANVQRPAAQYRQYYERWQPVAVALVRALDQAYSNPPGSAPGSAAGGQGTAELFLQIAMGQLGDKYLLGANADYDDSNPSLFDCSELVEWAAYRAGVRPALPEYSMDQLAVCRKAGLEISVEEAFRTRGALLFKTYGTTKHVEISLGNVQRQTMGANWGLGVQVFGEKRGWGKWSTGARVPGMIYQPPWNPDAQPDLNWRPPRH